MITFIIFAVKKNKNKKNPHKNAFKHTQSLGFSRLSLQKAHELLMAMGDFLVGRQNISPLKR